MITPNEALVAEIEQRARNIRKHIVKMGTQQKCHIGGSLSLAEIMAVLYFDVLNVDPRNPGDPERDYFVLSKGHATPALYATLAERGFFPESELRSFMEEGSRLYGHASVRTPGVELSTGSMGHGLPAGLGMALGCRMDGGRNRVYVVMGDGELQEGTNWEAALAAAHHDADNLFAIVDRNRYQACDLTEVVCTIEPLYEKWFSFGWGVQIVDGHSVPQLLQALHRFPLRKGKPTLIIALTVKGKGVSLAEAEQWHYAQFTPEEADRALEEICGPA